MTDIDSIHRFWRELINHIHEEILPAWNKAMEDVGEVFAEFTEAIGEVQAKEKKRAYEHLITPPHDHTHAHVTHTNTKPPHPTRTYRRRTP